MLSGGSTYGRDDLRQKKTPPTEKYWHKTRHHNPRTISTADPAGHKGSTGARTDGGSPSRTQGSVTAAQQRHGFCTVMGTARSTILVSILCSVNVCCSSLACAETRALRLSHQRRQRARRAHKVRAHPVSRMGAARWAVPPAVHSAGLRGACCCAMPSTETSTSKQYLHSVGYSRALLILPCEYSYSGVFVGVADQERYGCTPKRRTARGDRSSADRVASR